MLVEYYKYEDKTKGLTMHELREWDKGKPLETKFIVVDKNNKIIVKENEKLENFNLWIYNWIKVLGPETYQDKTIKMLMNEKIKNCKKAS